MSLYQCLFIPTPFQERYDSKNSLSISLSFPYSLSIFFTLSFFFCVQSTLNPTLNNANRNTHMRERECVLCVCACERGGCVCVWRKDCERAPPSAFSWLDPRQTVKRLYRNLLGAISTSSHKISTKIELILEWDKIGQPCSCQVVDDIFSSVVRKLTDFK